MTHDRNDRLLKILDAKERKDVRYLIDALREPDLRGNVVNYLIELNAREAVPSIAPLLNARDPHTRCDALAALAHFGVAQRKNEIREVARNDSVPWVRAWAIDALLTLDVKLARSEALRAIGDSDSRVRAESLVVLKRCGIVDDIPRLRRALEREKKWLKKRRYRKAIKTIENRLSTS